MHPPAVHAARLAPPLASASAPSSSRTPGEPCRRRFLHGGVMRWAGIPHCYTNRAGIWAFITRDKSAPGVWRRLTFLNLGHALNHYIGQAIRVRCPDYDTLRTTNPAAAERVRLAAGEAPFEDIVHDRTLWNQIDGQFPKLAGRLGDLTFGAVQHAVRSRNSEKALTALGRKPTPTAVMQIWSQAGEGGHPKGRSVPSCCPLARLAPSRVMCSHCRKDAVPADGREGRRPRVR